METKTHNRLTTAVRIMRSGHVPPLVPVILVACLLLGSMMGPTAAGELKRTGPHNMEIPEWSSSADCQISYYNTCTGWIWGWGVSEYTDSENTVTVDFDACCSDVVLEESRIFMLEGSGPYSGYGFTGTITIRSDPDNCGIYGDVLASQPWLPVAGDNVFSWGIPVPERFSIRATLSRGYWDEFPNPAEFASDHPAPGPSGGDCYPHDRYNHTYYSDVYCPGWCCPLIWDPTGQCAGHGWACDVQLAFDAALSCAVHLESKSWAGVKALYR